MTFILFILSYLVALLRAIFFDGPRALLDLLRQLFALLRAGLARSRLSEWERKSADSDCVPIHEPAFHHPDPLIYSQYFFMQQGLAVTWDNPDIVLTLNGTEVPSYDIKKDTDYEIVARIWNSSSDAPVVGLPVKFSYLSFGVGTVNHPIGETTVDLGVKGGPNHPAFASMTWHTPDIPGHYCIQVVLDWFDDLNPFNNLGQENANVGYSQSPVAFEFKLRNAELETLEYRFAVDTYQIPALLPCPEDTEEEPAPPRGRLAIPPIQKNVLGRHGIQKFPIPTGWSIEIQPEHPTLSPGEEIDVRVVVTPAEGFHGNQPINVNAFNRLGMAGGVTLNVIGT